MAIDVKVLLAVAQELGLIDALKGLLSHKPKPPVLVPEVPTTPNVPTPIPAPPASTPEPGQVARKIAKVRLQIQKAERPDLSTPERRQDPGNLYPDPNGMVTAGDNFNWGSAFWFDMSAFDENGDEWQGNSIIAAGKEYKTRHEIWEGGRLVAFIQGAGGSDAGSPFDWSQQNGDEINWAQRSWKDSLGMNARVRIGREGTFHIVAYFDGVKSNEFDVHVS